MIHEPRFYACPLCKVAGGAESEAVVYEDDTVMAAVSLHQKANNAGSVLVFPRAHGENLYSASAESLTAIHSVAQRVSIALKRALLAEGVTVIQNNEPAGGQDVWHLHVHVVPRYTGDSYHACRGAVAPMEQRALLAAKIRSALL
jgi:histidine triad (HIT) family protein